MEVSTTYTVPRVPPWALELHVPVHAGHAWTDDGPLGPASPGPELLLHGVPARFDGSPSLVVLFQLHGAEVPGRSKELVAEVGHDGVGLVNLVRGLNVDMERRQKLRGIRPAVGGASELAEARVLRLPRTSPPRRMVGQMGPNALHPREDFVLAGVDELVLVGVLVLGHDGVLHGPDDAVRALRLGLLVQDAGRARENAEEEEAHVVALLVAAVHVRLLDLAQRLEAGELVLALFGETQLVVAEHAVAVDVGLEVALELAASARPRWVISFSSSLPSSLRSHRLSLSSGEEELR